MADAAGVKRLAQSQYETEFREPRISYLPAVGAAGVDLYYLLFGRSVDTNTLTPEQQTEVERRTFDLIEEYALTQCGGQLSSDGRFVLFGVIRAKLTRSVNEGAGMDLTVSDLLASRRTSNG